MVNGKSVLIWRMRISAKLTYENVNLCYFYISTLHRCNFHFNIKKWKIFKRKWQFLNWNNFITFYLFPERKENMSQKIKLTFFLSNSLTHWMCESQVQITHLSLLGKHMEQTIQLIVVQLYDSPASFRLIPPGRRNKIHNGKTLLKSEKRTSFSLVFVFFPFFGEIHRKLLQCNTKVWQWL